MTHEGIDAIRALLADVGLGQGTIQEQRAAMEAGVVPVDDDVVVEPDTVGGRPAEWVVTAGADRSAVVLYLHGGGYAMGGLGTHRGIAAALARATGRPFVVLDYRLAPEHPFPAALDDVLAALDDLAGRGIPVERTALAGDSAGGGLALAALGALVGDDRPTPAATVAFSPWTDLTLTSVSMTSRADLDPMCSPEGLAVLADAYLAGADPRDPLISPRFTRPEVLAGFPPLHIDVGDQEVLLDDATGFAASARAAGVEVELTVWLNLVHVFQLFPPELVPEATESIGAAGAFLARHLT